MIVAVASLMISLAGSLLGGLEIPKDAQAIARSTDGKHLAVAWPVEGRVASRLRVSDESGAAEPREIELAGRVRALLFVPDDQIFVLRHRPAKRREGDTDLLRLDLASLETRDQVQLAPSARALDHWPNGAALLIACRDEIRSVLLPGLQSGPLFRVPGENLAMVRIEGDRILLGQEKALAIVDLADPPGELEMPLRAKIEAPLPIVGLALEGSETALARLSDGSLLRVTLDPLSLDLPPGQEPSPSPPASSPEQEVAADDIPLPVLASPDVSTPPPPSPSPGMAPQPTTPPQPSVVPPQVQAPAQVRGTLVGADLSGRAIVLLGPDHLLREAARVTVGPDGRWEARGLAPGRYRVHVDGGDRAVISDPDYRMIEIVPGAPAVDADFRLVGAP